MKKHNFLERIGDKFHSSKRMGVLMTALFIAAVMTVNIVLFGLASRFGWYFRTDTVYEHTISDATDGYLSEVKDRGTVRILFCDAKDSLESDEVYNLVYQTACQYAEKYDFVSVENVNIFTNPELVEPYKYELEPDGSYKKDPETGKRIKINEISTSTVIFVSERDFAVLPMHTFFVLDEDQLITAYNGEEVTAAMIHRVLSVEDRPLAYFTANHGETYATAFYYRLLFAGYTMKEVDLWSETPDAGDGNILIISNPRYDFDRGDASHGVVGEIDRIQAFTEAGGTVYAMLDPLITGTVQLEKFLSEWGITVMRAETSARAADTVFVRDSADAVTTDGYGLITSFGESDAGREMKAEMDRNGAGRVIVSQASPLILNEVAGKTVSSLLVSSSASQAYAGGSSIDTAGSYTVAAMSRDTTTGGGVFAVGSVYLAAQNAITTNEYGNKDFVFLVFRHLSGASVPLGSSYLLFSSTGIEDLTMWEARIWTILFAGILPVGVAVTGVICIRRRRNR